MDSEKGKLTHESNKKETHYDKLTETLMLDT